MNQPTREEVEAFITALNYGMKVQHKPEFLIALAEGWLENTVEVNGCEHNFTSIKTYLTKSILVCKKCGESKTQHHTK